MHSPKDCVCEVYIVILSESAARLAYISAVSVGEYCYWKCDVLWWTDIKLWGTKIRDKKPSYGYVSKLEIDEAKFKLL